jgi:hypothetical protein
MDVLKPYNYCISRKAHNILRVSSRETLLLLRLDLYIYKAQSNQDILYTGCPGWNVQDFGEYSLSLSIPI